jgi:hypothetical protein
MFSRKKTSYDLMEPYEPRRSSDFGKLAPKDRHKRILIAAFVGILLIAFIPISVLVKLMAVLCIVFTAIAFSLFFNANDPYDRD